MMEQGRAAVNIPLLLEKTYTRSLLRRIYFDSFLGNAVEQQRVFVRNLRGKTNTSPEEAAERYSFFVENTILLLQARQGRTALIYALQPVRAHTLSKSSEERFKGKISSPAAPPTSNLPATLSFYRRASKNFARLRAKYNSPGIQIADLTKSLPQQMKPEFYVDDCHTEDRGNTVIAQKLAELVHEVESKND